jgi:starch synthase
MTSPKKRVLFVSSEMTPFLNESPVSTIARFLPQAIQEKDNEVRVLVPRFGVINERRNKLHEVVRLSGINISIDDKDNPLTIKVASIPEARMQVYFLDNEDYYHRKFLFSDEQDKAFDDNDERVIFFCKGVLETVKKLGWSPDIIHCQGWMTSLIPIYLKTLYKDEPVFKNAKIVYSVFENEISTELGKDFARKASLNEIEDKYLETFAKGDSRSMQLGGIQSADAIVDCTSKMDADCVKLAKNKPHMVHEADNLGDKYMAFYDQLIASSK